MVQIRYYIHESDDEIPVDLGQRYDHYWQAAKFIEEDLKGIMLGSYGQFLICKDKMHVIVPEDYDLKKLLFVTAIII